MTFLSIIIPVYNVKDYLTLCVNSVITECDGLDYEILLIDDGSTDGSGTLCDELATQQSRILALHKANGGLSDARNYGAVHATGEYIFYLDSDDYLVPGGLIAEIAAAKKNGSDVVCGNFYYQYSNHATMFNDKTNETLTFKGGEESLRVLIEGRYYQNFAWGKLIRRELAQKFLFPKGKLFEDTYWFHHILHNANKVTVVNDLVVYYVQRDGSISFKYNLKSLDILDGYVERLQFFEQHYPALVNKHKLLMAENCISQAWMVCRCLNKNDRLVAVKEIRCIINDCKLQENILLNSLQKRKLCLIMRSMNYYKVYYILERIIKKLCL